jgi:predicted Rossmann fold nucleotide-binding protein DprA/Smf involved in DNA uptake
MCRRLFLLQRTRQAAADVELWESQGHTFLTILDDDYPVSLLSQFWPDAPPQKYTFLMGNATSTRLCTATRSGCLRALSNTS